jgi:hypothetical protein
MTKLGTIVAAAIAGSVLLALATSESRVASESAVAPSDSWSLPGVERRPDVFESEAGTPEQAVNQDTLEDSTNRAEVRSETDVDVSVSHDVSVDVSGGAVEPEVSGTVDGQPVSCPNGQRVRWEDEDTKFRCRNSDGRIDMNVDNRGGGSFSIKLRIP